MHAQVQTRADPAPDTGEPTAAQARALVGFAQALGGISIDPTKRDFLRTRLGRLLRALDLASYDDLVDQAMRSDLVKKAILEELTTHTTSFYRERRHFAWLQDHALPDFFLGRKPVNDPFTIWSAACSTGAELWTAGFEVVEFATRIGRTLPFRLIGTDVSDRILKTARGATFTDTEVDGVPPEILSRHFRRADGAHANRPGHIYRVKSELRAKAEFRQLNLLEPSFAPPFKADVVFLRNVLIYFQPTDRDRVVKAVVDRLHPGGALLTGHSEAIDARRFGMTQHAPSIYRKP